MTDSPVAITMPVEDGLPIGWLTDLVVDAEQAGIDTALVGEVAGPEAFATLGAMAARTERIRLGSGIVAAYTRSPALTAMGFATLASLAPGRIVAGIGPAAPSWWGAGTAATSSSPWPRCGSSSACSGPHWRARS